MTDLFAAAPADQAGMSPESEGAVVVISGQSLNAMTVFASPASVDTVIAKLRADVLADAAKLDASTAKGRDAIKSLAHKVARSKTALDAMGKDLVADWKRKADLVDADRRRIREQVDALKEEVRRPVTEYEEWDANRIAEHESMLAEISALAVFDHEYTSAMVRERIAHLAKLPPRNWDEFKSRSEAVIKASTEILALMLANAERHEAEQAELARLRAEEEERRQQELARLQRERDEQIAREAAERARLEAEEAARVEAERVAKAERLERERIEREAKEALEAAEREARRKADEAEAERKRIEIKAALDAETARQQQKALEQAAQDAIKREQEAERNRERDRLAAEQRERDRAAQAEREKQAAIAAERQRQADEAAEAERQRIQREANKRHAAKIHNEMLADLISKCDISEPTGKAVVTAIVSNLIRHVRAEY